MTNQHPITPPPELVGQWRNLPEYVSQLRTMSMLTITTEKLQDIATRAARWGADQELDACCEWLEKEGPSGIQLWGDDLRAARRPKPLSLKEQALDALNLMLMFIPPGDQREQGETIRRALEQLSDD